VCSSDLSQHDFSFLAPCPASGILIHGDRDEIVPVDSVDKLAAKLKSQKNITIDYEIVKGCDHFFGDHMAQLNKIVDDYLDKSLAAAA